LNRFPFRTDSQMKEASLEAAAQIAHELTLESLSRVIELLL
jgi:hypothetical protein